MVFRALSYAATVTDAAAMSGAVAVAETSCHNLSRILI
jgi:hypothetical protein